MIRTTSLQPTVHEDESKSTLGFWIYLMTDCIIFATLFAVYAVMQNNTFGGPGGSDIFDIPFVLIETLLLLTSSYTMGLVLLALHRRDLSQIKIWLGLTFMLGAAFLGMELYEFRHLIHEGHTWQQSGFLSAYFTLVGTHGLHILVGLLWIAVLLAIILRRGLSASVRKRLLLLSLFWHFLDIIWIFIFTIVYLAGVL
ncbi:cytochrome o ubiquinol oxidase subunit III [Candidatus Saccharibacteria bacterium]|nr:MAG: cytochrome o ubiquinol oxidase subunit III [Candidatus Saccharibacteria bacterium]